MRDTKHLGKHANKLAENAKEKNLFRTQRKAVEAEVVSEEDTEAKSVPADNVPRPIQEGITVGQLASQLGELKSTELIMSLMGIGVMANVNQSLDYETLIAISDQFDFEPVRQLTFEEKILAEMKEEDDPEEALGSEE